MASKPIKKVLQSIRNGKSIALAISESDLDAEERDILVMSILDIVKETKRLETKEDWAGRVTERLERIETVVKALIDHERKTQEAFTAMTQMFEALITADVTLGALHNPMPVDFSGFRGLRLVEKPEIHYHVEHNASDDPMQVG